MKDIFDKVKSEGRNNLTEFESRKLLEKYKIPVVKAETASTLEELIEKSERIGYPVVLKVLSKDIIHKTEAGGVALDIKNERELAMAYTSMLKKVKSKFPKAKIDGFFVQQMLKNGYEIIVGGKRDEVFGPVVMIGFGGIFVEIFDDVAFRVVPISKEDVMDMINEIKAGKILKGFRGRKPADVNAIADVVLKTAKILIENPEIKEIDINPLIADENKAIAVDARVILNSK